MVNATHAGVSEKVGVALYPQHCYTECTERKRQVRKGINMQRHKVTYYAVVNGKSKRCTAVWGVKKSGFFASEFIQDMAKNGVQVASVVKHEIMPKARNAKKVGK